jgi:hypothetical protein
VSAVDAARLPEREGRSGIASKRRDSLEMSTQEPGTQRRRKVPRCNSPSKPHADACIVAREGASAFELEEGSLLLRGSQ